MRKVIKRYYYYHAESDSIWSSNLPLEKEGNPDGCIEPISKKKALELLKEHNKNVQSTGKSIDNIPHYVNRKLQIY